MEWMLDIQLGRRNLSPIQRIAITEKYRPIYEKQARENQSKAGGDKKSLLQNSSKAVDPENRIDVRAKLAETAGVSTDTYSKGKKILDSNNEEVKEKVLSGEMSINAGYKELTQGKEVLKDLIETNILQRGIGNPNPIKLGRCIKELERIYGVRDGSTNKQGTIVGENFSFTQKDLANELGLDIRTMQNYKKLTELVLELQDWVETGILAPTTAIALIAIYRMRIQNFVL